MPHPTDGTAAPAASGAPEASTMSELSLEREKIQIERERLALERERWSTERDKVQSTRELANRAAGRLTIGISTFACRRSASSGRQR